MASRSGSFLVPYAVSKPRLIFPWPSSSTAPCPSNQSFSWCSAANKTATLHFTRVVILQQVCSMRNQELLKSDENGSFFCCSGALQARCLGCSSRSRKWCFQSVRYSIRGFIMLFGACFTFFLASLNWERSVRLCSGRATGIIVNP